MSGIGFHLILPYILYSLHFNSYFPALKQVQRYINGPDQARDSRRGRCGRDTSSCTGHGKQQPSCPAGLAPRAVTAQPGIGPRARREERRLTGEKKLCTGEDDRWMRQEGLLRDRQKSDTERRAWT